MVEKIPDILVGVVSYYSKKLAEHGETARGVDWNGEGSQTLRFAQLCKVIDGPCAFSLNDLGCGYGALYEYLTAAYSSFEYRGIDVSQDMIRAARMRYRGAPNAHFSVSAAPRVVADYGIASGIFNVRLEESNRDWQCYVRETLDLLDRTSAKGFAFNCLTSYSDPELMRGDLHYADACELFDFCKTRYSPNVALLHDYGLYEFTVLVRKQL